MPEHDTCCPRFWWVAALCLMAMSWAAGDGHAGTKILQNDGFADPAPVTCQLGAVEDEILAARFAPDQADYPFTIERVFAFICPSPQQGFIYLRIWADDGVSLNPGAPIFSGEFSVTGSNNSLTVFDLGAENIVVTDGSIRVGIELFQDPGPSVATDLDGSITSNANLVYAFVLSLPAAWYLSETLSLSGDWIIRVEIETPGATIFADGFESGNTAAWSETVSSP